MKFSRSILPIILMVFLIIGVILHSINSPMKVRKMKELQYKGFAIAKILSIDTVKNLHFYHVGNEILTESYIVNYNFKVGEQTFTGTDKIFNHKKFNKLISKLRNKEEIFVLYEISDPSKNILSR